MTPDEARHLITEGINYAAYRETESSLYDADKNRLFGAERYNPGRFITRPSPWSEGDFEEKMATLLNWANVLNRSVPEFQKAQAVLESDWVRDRGTLVHHGRHRAFRQGLVIANSRLLARNRVIAHYLRLRCGTALHSSVN